MTLRLNRQEAREKESEEGMSVKGNWRNWESSLLTQCIPATTPGSGEEAARRGGIKIGAQKQN